MFCTVHEVTCQQEEVKWDHFVSTHPSATGYHLMAWSHIFANVLGHRTIYLFASDSEGQVVGVLPFVVLSSKLFGTYAVSLPAVNYGGLVADDVMVQEALLRTAARMAKGEDAKHLELRQMSEIPLAWPVMTRKVSMRLDLPQRFEDLMMAFPPKLRSQVRRGEKEGMYTRMGGLELLDDFYEVFSRNMRDLGTPVYGKYFFKEMLTTFPKDARLCCVYLQDQVMAAGFLYGFRHTLEIPWAASDRRYARIAPNMMLYGAVLKYACEQGYQVFDFGRSSKDSGTYRFKEQWGARPVQLHWHYWLQSGDRLPELNPQNPKYQLAIETWKRLPLPLANWLGPRVSKYLP